MVLCIKRKLVTNVGDFGPGDFVWFKAGTKMYHGADKEDVDVLFMSDSKVDINYYNRKWMQYG